MNQERFEDIRKQCVIKQQPTGVIQEALMNQGMSLAEADIIIEKWYKGLPEDWFDGGWKYLCTIQVSTEYDLTKLRNSMKKEFNIDLCGATRYLSGCYESDLFYDISTSTIPKEGN